MELFRVFAWDRKSLLNEKGGPFFVPRAQQGSGRHDIPELDGVLYVSLSPVGAVAETLQGFRMQLLTEANFKKPDEKILAIANFELSDSIDLVDLDNPSTLTKFNLRPSVIATRLRSMTRPIAAKIFDEGHAGLLWPSSLESTWINATLFESRIKTHIKLKTEPLPVSIYDEFVREACSILGIYIER